MGVPAFYRWLSEKYPKIVQDVLEERVKLVGGQGSTRAFFDSTRPNPSGLECDNLYIDMNGIIHPCSHPEQGPQPSTEEEMYENVCHYVDRLFRAMRPRKLLYLAIDGVAPRAKMNQQRARRFRSAQEARENQEVEEHVRQELTKMGQKVPPAKNAWDSNVITPGTPFMLRLSEYLRFYIRKRISTDKAWKGIRVIFSDASVPGEGEHKIMAHIRLQRSQPGYLPNLVHVLHGLDADLIMLALATHEAHFYISREEVLFGRKSQEQTEQRQLETGFRDKQKQLDEEAGESAMQLLENRQKPLCRISIPILREYLASEFASCITRGRIPFEPSLERLLDDIVFLCFFVGNDFLPHLPSLDIRDGALDYLFNVYKRLLPSLGDYITNHGGQVNLSHVDVILAEVGAIEDYVFSMKHENEEREKERRKQLEERKKQAKGRSLDAPPPVAPTSDGPKFRGRAARILEKNQAAERALAGGVKSKQIKVSHMKSTDNLEAAMALKKSLGYGEGIKLEGHETKTASIKTEDINDAAPVDQESISNLEITESAAKETDGVTMNDQSLSGSKRKREESDNTEGSDAEKGTGIGQVGTAEEEFEDDAEDDAEDDEDGDGGEQKPSIDETVVDPEVAKAFKEKVKNAQKKKLDEYSKNVEDKVRLHESGWKDRYYSDKCKADDVAAHGGREHLFRSYVMGLCWVMKYYYDGCPSWKWYFPFHYAPFASDLRNIERFEKDVKSFELNIPFNPVEQLMAVLPSDSSHAIPKQARWLMMDPESPIIDFYPKDVPVDPNGKAMPWLWVVLLPFIEEDRLLGALTPTMEKWTKEELFCNARGLDDGYLFVHDSHPLSQKLKLVLQPGKTAKSPKTRLTDSVSYGCAGFTGSVRPPLSNEILPVDGDSRIQRPKGSAKADYTSHDNLFTEDIDTNLCVCVAFSEPPKLSHKSILLPAAVPPKPCLSPQDLQIRRPRLNRGGGTIANMGTGNGQSFKSGYGSMNISSYEREVAQRTGRGNQMYQTGMRAWGAMEPTPKQAFQASNPFSSNGRGNGGTRPPPPPPPNRPPWQGQQQVGGFQQFGTQSFQHQQHQQQIRPPPYQQPPQHQQQYHNSRQGQRNVVSQQGYQNSSQHNQGYQPPLQAHPRSFHNPRQGIQSNPHQQRQQFGNQTTANPSQRQQGFNFRAYNQAPPGGRPNQPNPPSARANANVMNSLKAQLASTLKQNRRPQDRR